MGTDEGDSFNKTEEDFGSLRDYNDYLEEVEEISNSFPPSLPPLETIFSTLTSLIATNLISSTDVSQTELKILAYQTENRELIALNLVKTERELEGIKKREQEEREEMERVREGYEGLEREEERAREEERNRVIMGLVRPPPSLLLLLLFRAVREMWN